MSHEYKGAVYVPCDDLARLNAELARSRAQTAANEHARQTFEAKWHAAIDRAERAEYALDVWKRSYGVLEDQSRDAEAEAVAWQDAHGFTVVFVPQGSAPWSTDLPKQLFRHPLSIGQINDLNCEFIAARLKRVADLVGAVMPDMSPEKIVAVSGTILGQIAHKLDATVSLSERQRAHFDKLNAARYCYLRETDDYPGSIYEALGSNDPHDLDAAIDAELAKEAT